MIPLSEPLREGRDGYVDVWHVEPPPTGATFTVTHFEWTNAEQPERHIYAWSWSTEENL